MAKQSITVELDDETIRCLTLLGEPIDVLVRLASSAADGVSNPGHPKRERTDRSLRHERDKSDSAIAKEHAIIEKAADDMVLLARQRAKKLVQTAIDDAAREPPSRSEATKARDERARIALERDWSDADALVDDERAGRRADRARLFAGEREATDRDLIGERTDTDTLIIDQREANENMLRATIRADELAVEADAAKERAENSERELRSVAEFREMFIGMLGHDLRNPLWAINVAAGQLFGRGHLNDQDARRASVIIRSSERMTRMITQLLDFTRARLGGGLPIERTPTDLRDVCRNVVEEFEATVELEVEGDVTGTWDPDRLAETLSNLVGNAIEYAAPGTVVIVKARADEGEVFLEVCNQGEPIPADVLPFIFEPFRRARPGEKSKAGNLGLGLYIAHQIVLSHGGKLDAHSVSGTTTFTMRLPRRLDPADR